MESIRLEIKRQPIHILSGLLIIALLYYDMLNLLILPMLVVISAIASFLIKKTRPTIVDFGARFNWYCCDITRTFAGTSKEWKTTKEAVKNIQEEIIDFVKPGVGMEDIKKLYEKLMGKHRYKIHHSFGHGIGLEVHEQITGKLKENMVITVEPGVYKHSGGCRIEDTILVKKGKAEILTKSIKHGL